MTMRSVDTRFWSDGWVRKLNALDRYLFLYLLTNEHTNWCGVYELDIAMMAFESGIDERDLERSLLPRLVPKVIYVDGWVYIPNFPKYHLNGTKDTQKGYEKAFDSVPERIRLRIREIETQGVVPPTLPSSAFASASALLVAVAKPPAVEIVSVSEESEDRPKKESRAKDKEAVYRLFSEKPQPWWIHKQQKEAAIRLFDMVGLEKVRNGLAFLKEHEGEQYFPEASTPYEYEQKLPAIARKAKKLV